VLQRLHLPSSTTGGLCGGARTTRYGRKRYSQLSSTVTHSLASINLSDNYLNNESVWHLCKMALYHPTLSSIDISCNPISWTGAMCMVELVNKNVHISRVSLMHTSMPPELVDAIGAQVLRNASIGSRKSRRGVNPCNHPTTIRQRALKRYFYDIAGKRDTVNRSRLADGLKEMWKISGREREITQRTPLFYENFNKRATSDDVTWEEFLILIMLEDVLFNANYTERIRTVFNQFDVDGGGYVEVRELSNMMTYLSSTMVPPKPEEVRAKMSFYDLDETMTLTWDEFLLLLYDHGPVVDTKAELTATPLTQLPHAHHN